MSAPALYQGGSHASGNDIPVIVDGVKEIRVEGDEYKICEAAFNSDEVISLKAVTNREALDYIHKEFSCKFKQDEADSGDFIICKRVVKDDEKKDRHGTVKQILNEMQGEGGCKVEFGKGGTINNDAMEKTGTKMEWRSRVVVIYPNSYDVVFNSRDPKEATKYSGENRKKYKDNGALKVIVNKTIYPETYPEGVENLADGGTITFDKYIAPVKAKFPQDAIELLHRQYKTGNTPDMRWLMQVVEKIKEEDRAQSIKTEHIIEAVQEIMRGNSNMPLFTADDVKNILGVGEPRQFSANRRKKLGFLTQDDADKLLNAVNVAIELRNSDMKQIFQDYYLPLIGEQSSDELVEEIINRFKYATKVSVSFTPYENIPSFQPLDFHFYFRYPNEKDFLEARIITELSHLGASAFAPSEDTTNFLYFTYMGKRFMILDNDVEFKLDCVDDHVYIDQIDYSTVSKTCKEIIKNCDDYVHGKIEGTPAAVVAEGETLTSGVADKMMEAIHALENDVPLPFSEGGSPRAAITDADITEGAMFRIKSGTVFIIDKVSERGVETSIEGGRKGNYRDDLNEVVAFLNEESAVKIKAEGGTLGRKKFEQVMSEWKQGTLRHGSTGEVVPHDRQDIALAIAFAEARKIEPEFTKGGKASGKHRIKEIKLRIRGEEDEPYKVFTNFSDANQWMRHQIDTVRFSDMEYILIYDDGFEREGSIDCEPKSFWEGKQKPLTWHLINFYGNLATWKKDPLVTQEDREWAKDFVENYDLGEKTTAPEGFKELVQFRTDDFNYFVSTNGQEIVITPYHRGSGTTSNSIRMNIEDVAGYKKINKDLQTVILKALKLNNSASKIKSSASKTTPTGKYYRGTDYIYNNAYDLNKAIEELITVIKNNSKNPEDYSGEEKIFIAQYSGMGGLIKEGAEGKGILYEFYTPDDIIKRMYALAYKHGFPSDGNVAETACGTGRFFKYMPRSGAGIWTGWEINPVTATICRILYPQVDVRNESFETLFIKNNDTVRKNVDKKHAIYDLVITNPPYGEYKSRYGGMGERDYTKAQTWVEYFIYRGLDILKPKGLLIMIIGTEVAVGGIPFLAKGTNNCKKAIAEKSELLEAYRLPNGVFERTDVLTDIIVLRKK